MIFRERYPRLPLGHFLSRGLVGYWCFDEDVTRGIVARDLSGKDNHGTIYGATKAIGKLGQALNFDGNDYVDCGAAPMNLIEGSSQATLSYWSKKTAANSFLPVSARGSLDKFLATYWSNYNLYFNVGNGGDQYGYVSSQTSTDWQHIVMVFNGNLSGNSARLKGYINAVEQSLNYAGTTIGAVLSSNLPNFYIGYDESFLVYADGLIDDVRVYSRAISADEITALYQFGINPWRFLSPSRWIHFVPVGITPIEKTFSDINAANWADISSLLEGKLAKLSDNINA